MTLFLMSVYVASLFMLKVRKHQFHPWPGAIRDTGFIIIYNADVGLSLIFLLAFADLVLTAAHID